MPHCTVKDVPRLVADVTRLTQEHIAARYFPSAVVSVFDGRGCLFRLAFGDVRTQTLYDLASLTKVATATQVLLLVDDGRLSLQTRIADVLPDIQASNVLPSWVKQLTLFQLLTHSSRLPAWYPMYVEAKPFADLLNDAIRKQDAVQEVLYSDLNFMLLGRVLEVVCQAPLQDCVQQLLVKRHALGNLMYLPDKSFDIAPSAYGNPQEIGMCAQMNLPGDQLEKDGLIRGRVHDGNAWYYGHGVAGHAGLFGDAAALERLCRLYLQSDSPLLREALREQVDGRGLGFQTGEMYPLGAGHTGFTGTSLYLSPALSIGAVALTNRLYYEEENPRFTNEYRRKLHHLVARACGWQGEPA